MRDSDVPLREVSQGQNRREVWWSRPSGGLRTLHVWWPAFAPICAVPRSLVEPTVNLPKVFNQGRCSPQLGFVLKAERIRKNDF